MAEIKCRQQCFCTDDFCGSQSQFFRWCRSVSCCFLDVLHFSVRYRRQPSLVHSGKTVFWLCQLNSVSCTTIDFWTGLTPLFEHFVGAIVEYHIQTWALLSDSVTCEFPLSFIHFLPIMISFSGKAVSQDSSVDFIHAMNVAPKSPKTSF